MVEITKEQIEAKIKKIEEDIELWERADVKHYGELKYLLGVKKGQEAERKLREEVLEVLDANAEYCISLQCRKSCAKMAKKLRKQRKKEERD